MRMRKLFLIDKSLFGHPAEQIGGGLKLQHQQARKQDIHRGKKVVFGYSLQWQASNGPKMAELRLCEALFKCKTRLQT